MTQTIPQPAPLLPVNHATDRPLRVVLTIIAFLATLALLASRMSTRSYDNWQADLSGFATIQIMPVGEGDRERAASQALNAFHCPSYYKFKTVIRPALKPRSPTQTYHFLLKTINAGKVI